MCQLFFQVRLLGFHAPVLGGTPTAPKRKRGRPSKKELAQRAQVGFDLLLRL